MSLVFSGSQFKSDFIYHNRSKKETLEQNWCYHHTDMAFHFTQQNSYSLPLGERPQIPASTPVSSGRLFRATFNTVQKFRGFPVSVGSQDTAKTSCCPWDGELQAQGWAATRPAGQRHHWPWWARACCNGSQGCSSTQIIRQADNQVNLSSSLLLPILKLCKVLENLFFFASLLMVMAVASGCIVSVIFFLTLWWELFYFCWPCW